jgi:modulator of FtsH protease
MPGHSIATVAGTNKVIRNTYLLLAMTLAFSAVVASISLALNLPHPGLIVTLAGYFGLLFLTAKFRDRVAGIGLVFALTGFMGYTAGRSSILSRAAERSQIVAAHSVSRRAVAGSRVTPS